MISQRRVVQFGVLSAAAVFAACIGVLVFQGGDSDAAQSSKVQIVDGHSTEAQSTPISLSAAEPATPSQNAQH